MDSPEEWFKPEVIEKNAFAFMLGGAAMFYFIARMLKSGFFVLGDKAKLAAEAAVLEARVKALEAELAEKDSEIERLRSGK